MAEFETLHSERIDFNMGGDFLELSVTVARDEKRETRFLRLARGSYTEDGTPRYKRGGTTLPADEETLGRLADMIRNVDLSLIKNPEKEASGNAD